MRSSFILCLLLLASCGSGNKKSSIKMGQTTRADLIAARGKPLKTEVIKDLNNVELLEYENNEQYQLKDDVVVNSFKHPQGDATLLLYWKHKFKDCRTVTRQVKRQFASHTPHEMELSCPEQGLSVIYSDGSDKVSRVVEHETK